MLRSVEVEFFSSQKATFCQSTQSAIQLSKCSILFSFCIIVRRSVFGFLVYFWPSRLKCRLIVAQETFIVQDFFSFREKMVFEIFVTQKFYSNSLFRISRVLVRARSSIYFDCSCCWSYTVLFLSINWVFSAFFVRLSFSWFLLCWINYFFAVHVEQDGNAPYLRLK